MDWTLEVVAVPVSDVDRAKAFYADQVGYVGFACFDDPDGNAWAVQQISYPR